MKKIINKEGSKDLIALKEIVKAWSSEYLKSELRSLDELHNHIDAKKINDFRLYLFNQINTNFDWRSAVLNLAGDELRSIIGPDISAQKKINFSIILPNDGTSQLGMHSDSWSAESPFQVNLWMPITDTFGSNSMYLLDEKRTLEVTQSICNESFYPIPDNLFDENDFLDMKFGEILIFNPCLLHGNVINRTDKTRIALHLRFKNIYAPEIHDFPDRTTGIFYEPLEISENSKFALDYIKSAKGKAIARK